MKKVYLFCSGGMSTGILASNMQQDAEKRMLNLKVDAFPLEEMDEIMNKDKPDLVLLGPQIQFMFDEVKEKYSDKEVPILVIDSLQYGMMDGHGVLETALNHI